MALDIGNIANGIPEPYRLEIKDIDTSFSVESENLRNLG